MGLFGSGKKIDPKDLEKKEFQRSTSYLRAFSIYFNAEMGSGDYREALSLFEKGAELSDPEYQFSLGRMYTKGTGPFQSPDVA